MIEFKVAAEADAAKIGENEDVVEVPIDGVVYEARRPTAGQVGLLTVGVSDGSTYFAAVLDMVTILIGTEGRDHIKRLIRDRRIELADLFGGTPENPDGLVGAIISEFAGRPTVPSTASSASRSTGGRRSTGRSPGKGSTQSPSPSTDS